VTLSNWPPSTGCGNRCAYHLQPFQCSMIGTSVPGDPGPPWAITPTAQALVADTAVTDSR
jgi:hypothetical protein